MTDSLDTYKTFSYLFDKSIFAYRFHQTFDIHRPQTNDVQWSTLWTENKQYVQISRDFQIKAFTMPSNREWSIGSKKDIIYHSLNADTDLNLALYNEFEILVNVYEFKVASIFSSNSSISQCMKDFESFVLVPFILQLIKVKENRPNKVLKVFNSNFCYLSK